MAPDTEWSFPPTPPEHKFLTPYFQRAQELRTKDPVMAYWCTFYAVQEGITTKPQNTQFLMRILNVLEHMKTTLSDNEAVVNNSMGAAYIEDFALRVFNMADNEDRKGLATRSTAKKFLASANFLEVLRVFEKPLDADIIEKIRYAKWKAADLAKAFREGRQPTPGDIDAPPRSSEAAVLPSPPTAASLLDAPPSMSAWSPGTSLATSPAGQANQTLQPSPVAGVNVPLPPTIASSSPETTTHANFTSPEHVTLPLPPAVDAPSTPSPRAFGKQLGLDRDNGYATPGMWSTVATPGVDDVYKMNGRADERDGSPSARATAKQESVIINVDSGEIPLIGEDGESDGDIQDDAWSTIGNMPMSRQNSWSIGDHTYEPPSVPELTIPSDPINNGLGLHQSDGASSPLIPPPIALVKRVHFSPSVVGGLSSASSSVAGSSPPGSPGRYAPSLPTVQEGGAWESEGQASVYPNIPALAPNMYPPSDSESEGGSSSKDIPPVIHKIGSFAGLDAQSPIPQLPTTPRISDGSPAQSPSLTPRILDSFSPSSVSATVFPVVPSIPAGHTSLPRPQLALHPTPHYSTVPLDSVPKGQHHDYDRIPRPRVPTPPPDLSSTQISRIQKHCRFAISALDYEDAETARKELRAALAMLGG